MSPRPSACAWRMPVTRSDGGIRSASIPVHHLSQGLNPMRTGAAINSYVIVREGGIAHSRRVQLPAAGQEDEPEVTVDALSGTIEI